MLMHADTDAARLRELGYEPDSRELSRFAIWSSTV